MSNSKRFDEMILQIELLDIKVDVFYKIRKTLVVDGIILTFHSISKSFH